MGFGRALFGTGAFLLVAASAIYTAGCLNLNAEQCSTNADCLGGYVCGASNTCVKPSSANGGNGPVIIAGDGGAGCTTTAACTAANGGRPSLCRTPGQPCVDVVTDACPVVTDGWDNPDAIIVASMSQSRTQDRADAIFGDEQEAAMHLAINEFAGPGKGLTIKGTNHPLVGLFCSLEALKGDSERVADGQAVVSHLKDLGVHAAMVQDEHTLVPSLKPLVDADIFSMCSFCQTNPSAGAVDTKGIVWAALGSYKSEAPLWNHMLGLFEAKVRANPAYGVGSGGDVKVALSASPSDIYMSGLAEAVQDSLTWNGNKPLSQNTTNFLRTDNDYWVKDGSSASVYRAAQRIAAFHPHVVLLTNDVEASLLEVPLIESLWGSSQARPYYVMSPTQLDYVARMVGTNEDLRRRVVGILPNPDADCSANLTDYFVRLPSVLAPQYVPVSVDFGAASSASYDAFFSILYSMAASPQAVPTAQDIKAGMGRLIGPGPTINLDGNPSSVQSALAAFAAGLNVDLKGAGTNLDWDLSLAVIKMEAGSFCVDRDPVSSNPTFVFTGPTMHRPGDAITGSISCF